MSARIDNWESARDHALTLTGTELSQSYGLPAVKIVANGRSFVSKGHEQDTSFVVQIDLGTVEMLMETEPETYWQSPHYAGWPAVLVRFDSCDPDRVRRVIGQAHEQAATKKPVRRRK